MNRMRPLRVEPQPCFLREYVLFYAQAISIQEENQIGRGCLKNPSHMHGMRKLELELTMITGA